MKKTAFIILLYSLLLSCKKHPSNPPSVPGKATLSQPANNSACTTGTDQTSSVSTVMLSWAPSNNTGSYELHIRNLLLAMDLPTITTSQTQALVALALNTPFSWFVVSKSSSNGNFSQSETWKFYNAGTGAVTYAPFPAEIVSPTFGQQLSGSVVSVDLKWVGSTVANISLTYDVYFGTSSPPPLLGPGITGMSYNGLAVSSGNIYYWRVVTKDAGGNSSDSGVFQFSVK